MKTITVNSTNKRGQTATFTITAEKIGESGNFYNLTIAAPFEFSAQNGHAAITSEGTIRDYNLNNYKLKQLCFSSIILTPVGGTKKDRFDVKFYNEDLRS